MICRIRVESVFVTFRFRYIRLTRNLLGNGSTTSGRDSPTSNGEVDTRETDMSKEHIANELLNNLAPTTSEYSP